MEKIKRRIAKMLEQPSDYSLEKLEGKMASTKKGVIICIVGVVILVIITIWKVIVDAKPDFNLLFSFITMFILLYNGLQFKRTLEVENAKRAML